MRLTYYTELRINKYKVRILDTLLIDSTEFCLKIVLGRLIDGDPYIDRETELEWGEGGWGGGVESVLL